MPVFDPEDFHESIDFEAKLAVGRDGRGELPKSIWPSYSAFANTHGGEILLGAKQGDTGFEIVGIEDTDKVLDDLWSVLNDPAKVSVNLLGSDSVSVLDAGDGKSIIRICVPRAARQQRPVYINGNPIGGTYRRDHTGDYRCSNEQVSRLFAEQSDEPRDARYLPNHGMGRINTDTLRDYRNRFAALKSDHPFNAEDDTGFLRCIGGWYEDESSGESGLTLAGLLMFGKDIDINHELPRYFVDFRECDTPDWRIDWSHRIVPDGTWSGNVFDFYQKTIQYLFRDLRVPFKLDKDQRIDETPIHKALRESLVNTLIHADYTGRLPLLVVKAPGLFLFRNPGFMRVPVNQAMRGGRSDCRNANMQKMFSLLGLGEQAGSGVLRVISHWKSQHYRVPQFEESEQFATTELSLRTISLLPEETLRRLELDYGEQFARLDEDDRVIVATAEIEGFVSNVRVQQISDLHPRDITIRLQRLVEGGLLVSDGRGRATTYSLSSIPIVDLAKDGQGVGSSAAGSSPKDTSSTANTPTSIPDDPGLDPKGANSSSKDTSSRSKDTSSDPKDTSSGPKDTSSVAKDTSSGSENTSSTSKRNVDSKSKPSPDNPEWAQLWALALPIRSAGKVSTPQMIHAVVALCEGRFLTIAELAKLLGREPKGLRRRVLTHLLERGVLEWRFPNQPNHEQQAYRSTEFGLQQLNRGTND